MSPTLRVTCPTCAARLRAPSQTSRRSAKCPRCRGTVPLQPTEAASTDLYRSLSAEARALCLAVRAAASDAGRRHLVATYRAAGPDGRVRLTEATRYLRIIHALDGRERLDRRRSLALANRIPAEVLREMATLVESPAGEWVPSGEATLREAFDRFEEAAGLRAGSARESKAG